MCYVKIKQHTYSDLYLLIKEKVIIQHYYILNDLKCLADKSVKPCGLKESDKDW